MIDIIEKCDSILKELSKFSNDLLSLGPPILDNRLEMLEKKLNLFLPRDFKYLLKKHNGISLYGTGVYGIDEEFRGSSLDSVYHFEHELVGNKMPLHYFPFSPDGFGNHYCLNLLKSVEGISPVIFWQHDFLYKKSTEAEECNDSFLDWIRINEVMINWTLEDYNYDGTDR